MSVEIRNARSVSATVIGRPATVIAGGAAVIARPCIIRIIVSAAVLRCGDRDAGADNAGKSRRGCRTTAAAAIDPAGAAVERPSRAEPANADTGPSVVSVTAATVAIAAERPIPENKLFRANISKILRAGTAWQACRG